MELPDSLQVLKSKSKSKSMAGFNQFFRSMHELKKHPCQVCGSEFTHIGSLKRHMDNIHYKKSEKFAVREIRSVRKSVKILSKNLIVAPISGMPASSASRPLQDKTVWYGIQTMYITDSESISVTIASVVIQGGTILSTMLLQFTKPEQVVAGIS